MINRIKNNFRSNFVKKYLKINNLDKIKKSLLKEGYICSKIMKKKNISYFSAVDFDKNRFEFIKTDKDLFITTYLGSSSFYIQQIKVYSTNKDFDLSNINYAKEHYFFNVGKYTYLFFSGYSPYSRYGSVEDESIKNIPFYKNRLSSNEFVKRNEVKLVFVNIRNEIINSFIKGLPELNEINKKAKEKLIEKVGRDFILSIIRVSSFLLYNHGNGKNIFNIPLFKSKSIYLNYFLASELINKYSYSEEDLEIFFNNYCIPYILENKRDIISDLLKNKKNYDDKYIISLSNEISEAFFEKLKGDKDV